MYVQVYSGHQQRQLNALQNDQRHGAIALYQGKEGSGDSSTITPANGEACQEAVKRQGCTVVTAAPRKEEQMTAHGMPAASPSQGEAALRSPDGRLLAVPGTHNTVLVLDAASQTPWATYYGHQAGLYRREAGTITALVWLPDGQRLVSGSTDGSIHLWHARSGVHQRTLCQAQEGCAVLALTLSREGVLSAYRGGEVSTWPLG